MSSLLFRLEQSIVCCFDLALSLKVSLTMAQPVPGPSLSLPAHLCLSHPQAHVSSRL